MVLTISVSLISGKITICRSLFKKATAYETLRKQSLFQYQPDEFNKLILNEQEKFIIWSNNLFSEHTRQNLLYYYLEHSFSCSKTISTLLSELETVLLEVNSQGPVSSNVDDKSNTNDEIKSSSSTILSLIFPASRSEQLLASIQTIMTTFLQFTSTIYANQSYIEAAKESNNISSSLRPREGESIPSDKQAADNTAYFTPVTSRNPPDGANKRGVPLPVVVETESGTNYITRQALRSVELTALGCNGSLEFLGSHNSRIDSVEIQCSPEGSAKSSVIQCYTLPDDNTKTVILRGDDAKAFMLSPNRSKGKSVRIWRHDALGRKTIRVQ